MSEQQIGFEIGHFVQTPYGEGVIVSIENGRYLVAHETNPCAVGECWLDEWDLS